MNIKNKIDQIVSEYNMISNKSSFPIEDIDNQLTQLVIEYNNIPPEKNKIITIPNIFNKTYDENFISDYLAHLINPINNGIGIGPIKSLLNYCNIEFPIRDYYKPTEVKVIREFSFQDRGRIDILIIIKPDLIIAIENKIFSGEGHNQTLSYEQSIIHEFPEYNHIFVYLTPSKNNPPRSNNFIHLTYKDIVQILKEALPDMSGINRNIFLCNEFILHIEEYIMKNTNFELSEKSLLFIKYADVLQDIYNSFTNDADKLFDFIANIIQTSYLDFNSDFIFTFNKNRGYQFFQKNSWVNIKDLFIHFEFWFDSESLFLNDTISFMVDVEGKRNDQFFKKFESSYRNIKNDFMKNNISYRPSHRKVALAYKDYKLKLTPENLKPETIKDIFVEIFKEFEFLIPAIDDTIAKM